LVNRLDLPHVMSPNGSGKPDAGCTPGEAEPLQDAEILTRDQLLQREISAHQFARVRQRRKAQEVTYLLLKISEVRLRQTLENMCSKRVVADTGETEAIQALMTSLRVSTDEEPRRVIDYSSFRSPSWPS
jgi:hypothetical protein